MIQLRGHGNFKHLDNFFERAKEGLYISTLDEYGRKGVEALQAATPIDTGMTANSWYYTIERTRNSVSLSFYNSNVHNGVPIAIILQSGHATRNGGWVEGIDYINPAIRPIFEEMANNMWKEVISR
nr:MAG TPA: type I neck protein [Caudoviricetes sp.]DAP36407.1 MAG TPA: type I neck protein [Caudoviricetes sp.]